MFIRLNNFKFKKFRVLNSGDLYCRCTNKKYKAMAVVRKLYATVIQVKYK